MLQHRFLLTLLRREIFVLVFMQRSWVPAEALCSVRPIFFPSGTSFSTWGTAYSCNCNIASLEHFQPPWTPLPFRTVSDRTLSTLSSQCLSRCPRWPFWSPPSRVFWELKTPTSWLLCPRWPASTPLACSSAVSGSYLPHTRNLLGSLLSAVFPEDIWQVKVPHENKG